MATQTPPYPVSRPAARTGLSILLLIFIFIFSILVYTFAHESGHSLVGLLLGGRLTSFSVNFFDLSAHAGIEGDFSALQSAVISASGISLPLLLWAGFICLVPRKTNPLMELFRLVISMAVINSLLAWIIVPIVVFSGGRANDDSVGFLDKTHLHPILLSGIALLIFIAAWALFLNRLGGWRGIRSDLRAWRLGGFASIRRTLIWMLASAGIILAVVGVLSITLENPNYYVAPPGYHQVAVLDLSQKSYQNEAVYFFNLTQASRVSLFFALEDIQSGPVRIDLAGPGGYQQTFLRYDEADFEAPRASVNPAALLLQPGEYRVLVTFPQAGGTVSISILVEEDL